MFFIHLSRDISVMVMLNVLIVGNHLGCRVPRNALIWILANYISLQLFKIFPYIRNRSSRGYLGGSIG